MRRGDVVTVAVPGDYGKPRPAVVVQSDALPPEHDSVVVCQMTSLVIEPADFRLTIEPTEKNGLRRQSQIMVDKPVAVRRDRIGRVIGNLSAQQMRQLNTMLALTLGLAD